MVGIIRRHNFTAHSDQELRSALWRLKYLQQSQEAHDGLLEAFAIVKEAVSRRLGIWRLFDESFDLQNFHGYWQSALSKAASSEWTGNLRQAQADPDGHSPGNALDKDGKVVVDTMVRVAREGKSRTSGDILLPAEFYGAVRRKDINGILNFGVTDEQLMAGLYMLQGNIVQMNAGEGKTISAAFPGVVSALEGNPVHIITANDYLAARDAGILAPVYESLGVTVGTILGYMEDDERRHNYRKAVAYSTMRELGFDFLRDNLKSTPEAQVQVEPNVAIIDEVDHALIDEAATPMIISGEPLGNRAGIAKIKRTVLELIGLQDRVAQDLADRLASIHSGKGHATLAQLLLADPDNPALQRSLAGEAGLIKRVQAYAEQNYESLTSELFYIIDPAKRFVTLAEKGREVVEQRLGSFYDGQALEESTDSLLAGDGLSFEESLRRSAKITRKLARQYNVGNRLHQMLRAFLLLKRDVHYVVTEDSIVLIDQYTGRPKPDCIYQHGLQSALEVKEGLLPQSESEVLGQISVEGFIKRYRMISGMTGTASSSAAEFQQRYDLPVVVLPPFQDLKRMDEGYRIYLTDQDKTSAIIDEVSRCHQVGQPVLVGTQSVEQSAKLACLLSEKSILHNLLNAVNCDPEAQIVRDAGKFGAVTVATNMAGRGTDILLEANLDSRITEQFVHVITELLSTEARTVQVNCHSKPEARIMRTALVRAGLFKTVPGNSSDSHHISVTMKSGPSRPDRRLRLDFSLGLRVIGTEINLTPRVDLQLNGRSGRQGAFGMTQEFLSLEDKLINLHVEGILKHSKCRNLDQAGRTYYAGNEINDHVIELQRAAELEVETQTGLIQDYLAVSDWQTHLFYRSRQQVVQCPVDSGILWNMSVRLAHEQAADLVGSYFPDATFEQYAIQFDRMADEVRWRYQVDTGFLKSTDLTLLPEEIGHLFLDRLEELQDSLGRQGFSSLARQAYLRSCDEMWKSHLAQLQDSISNQLLANINHKSAVAHYIGTSVDAWRAIQTRAKAGFLSRLLTLPATQANQQPANKVRLNEDVELLLLGAGDSGRANHSHRRN